MIYKEDIGKIYDTLFFCIEYFNKQEVEENIISRFTDTAFMVECYEEIKRTVPYLPEILKPLFLYHNQTQTVMTAFFTEHIDYEHDTIDSFLRKITAKADTIYSNTLSALFLSNLDESRETLAPLIAPASYIEALKSSEYPDDFKLQISLLFGNFNYAISLLVEQLALVFNAVDCLHHNHSELLSSTYTQIISERNLQLYDQVLGTFFCKSESDCYCTIVLLNQYTTLLSISDSVVGLLVGLQHEEDLNNRFNEQNIDLYQLLISVGNGTRLHILNTLIEQRELTATAIAKIIKVPLTTVLRHIDVLYESGVIFISRRSGLQIFYQINYSLLSKAIKLLNTKIGGLIDGQQNAKRKTAQMD